jgi:hypothetical protein
MRNENTVDDFKTYYVGDNMDLVKSYCICGKRIYCDCLNSMDTISYPPYRYPQKEERVETYTSVLNPNDNIIVSMDDNVDHPKHYKGKKFEVIDIIEDFELGFSLGNAIKYILRAGDKDPTKYEEDLEKAIWYIKREIKNHA